MGMCVHRYIHMGLHTYIHEFIHTYFHTYRHIWSPCGPLSFLLFGYRQWRPCYIVPGFHRIISLCTACGDSVFCCSGTASSDPCQFFSFHHIISLGTACGDSVFCSVTDFCESSGAASGDPFVPFDFIASFLWAPPVATQFSVVRAPPVATLVITFHRSISVRTACGNSAFCSVIHTAFCVNN